MLTISPIRATARAKSKFFKNQNDEIIKMDYGSSQIEDEVPNIVVPIDKTVKKFITFT